MPGDPIQHVIVLMLENRAFDQMLGCLIDFDPRIEGIKRDKTERDSKGQVYFPQPIALRTIDEDMDPRHEYANVLRQIDPSYGFTRDYSSEFPSTSTPQLQQIMAYFADGALPALHQLGKAFAVCDNWFSSVPGPTWANRLFMHSGTSKGYVQMYEDVLHPHLHKYNQDTIYDRLNEKGKSWKIYHAGIPQSVILTNLSLTSNRANFADMDEFDNDILNADSFPSYAFIEPAYSHIFGSNSVDDTGKVDLDQPANDDHPPHDVLNSEKLIARIYNSLVSNTKLWESSLLIILFDEHGGFYDHVLPPKAEPPDSQPGEKFVYRYKDGSTEDVEARFDRYGVRVPALLVSPWTNRHVCKTLFDHTSILQYLSIKWRLNPLGSRVAAANNINIALNNTMRPPDSYPHRIDVATPPTLVGPTHVAIPVSLNQNQLGIMRYTNALAELDVVKSGATVYQT